MSFFIYVLIKYILRSYIGMNRLYDEKLVSRYKKQIQEKYQLGTDELKWQTFTPGECIYEQGFPLPYLCFLVKGIHQVSLSLINLFEDASSSSLDFSRAASLAFE